MEKEFTLKNVLEVLESNGFHVQSALEERQKNKHNSSNLSSRAIVAIFLKIVPKPKG